jgi:hypothetical protein
MIIVEKDKPWPQDLQMDYGVGCHIVKDMPFTRVVTDAISAYWQKFGFKPTHILVPLRFRCTIRSQVECLYSFNRSHKSDNDRDEIMGLQVVWSPSNDPMEILGDPNP